MMEQPYYGEWMREASLQLPTVSDIDRSDSAENVIIQRLMNRLSQSLFQELPEHLLPGNDTEINIPQLFSERLRGEGEIKQAILELTKEIRNREMLPLTLFFAPVIKVDGNSKVHPFVKTNFF